MVWNGFALVNAWFREKDEFNVSFSVSFDFQWQVRVLKKASYWQTVEKL